MRNRPFATQTFADWIHSLGHAEIPQETLHQAQRSMLDVIACNAAGRRHPSVDMVAQTAKANFARGSAQIWFSPDSASPIAAAMINANAATILDLDDGNRQAMGHPGGAVVPAVIAMGQEMRAPRDAMLRAIIAGYEIAVRVGAAEQRPSYHSANYTCFGVAAAMASLKSLPPQQIAHALGIVAYYGPRLSDLTLSKEMSSNVKESMPWSVVAGIMAADLAAAGFTGNRDALDIPERIDTEKLLDGLGDSYAIHRTYFKKYSCCRWIHSAVEAAVSIQRENGLSAKDIDRVEVETFSQAFQLNNLANPATLEGAQYSVPFSMAVAMVCGEDHLMPLTPGVLGHSDVVSLAEKIGVITSNRMNAKFPNQVPAKVTIGSGGESFAKQVDDPWGEASRPPTDFELVAKFQTVADGFVSEGVMKHIQECILSSETPIERLSGLLREPLVS